MIMVSFPHFCVLLLGSYEFGYHLVPVQSVAWKDLSPKWPLVYRVGR